MYRTSQNVLFVYGLLLIDLLINITDNLLPDQARQSYYILSAAAGPRSPQRPAAAGLFANDHYQGQLTGNSSRGAFGAYQQHHYGARNHITSSLAFSIFVLQVLAIVCVVVNLVLHFFSVSDEVRQSACLVKHDGRRSKAKQEAGPDDWQAAPAFEPLPQRLALKLVLDRYWWSLLVGLSYLVLTIILQIIKIDPSWHARAHQHQHQHQHHHHQQQQQQQQQQQWTSASAGAHDGESETDRNLLPILTVLIHKLMSTCYYVSFVVVYRASPSQMVNRVLQINSNGSHNTSR